MRVKFLKLHPEAKVPTKAHASDFCYDCYAVSCEEVAPNVYKYGLGFALQIERQDQIELFMAGRIPAISARPRSSVWKTGMVLANCIGTIDAGYTGEISAVFYHVMPNMPKYEVGDRVCQIYIDTTEEITRFTEVDALDDTERMDGGYGSTGR